MKTYFVIAIHWDEKKQAQAKYIAGQFPEYYLANIFKEAYNNQFSASAEVVEASELVNQ